jgi:hypothetical protein
MALAQDHIRWWILILVVLNLQVCHRVTESDGVVVRISTLNF